MPAARCIFSPLARPRRRPPARPQDCRFVEQINGCRTPHLRMLVRGLCKAGRGLESYFPPNVALLDQWRGAFGEEYRIYMGETGRLLPRFKKPPG